MLRKFSIFILIITICITSFPVHAFEKSFETEISSLFKNIVDNCRNVTSISGLATISATSVAKSEDELTKINFATDAEINFVLQNNDTLSYMTIYTETDNMGQKFESNEELYLEFDKKGLILYTESNDENSTYVSKRATKKKLLNPLTVFSEIIPEIVRNAEIQEEKNVYTVSATLSASTVKPFLDIFSTINSNYIYTQPHNHDMNIIMTFNKLNGHLKTLTLTLPIEEQINPKPIMQIMGLDTYPKSYTFSASFTEYNDTNMEISENIMNKYHEGKPGHANEQTTITEENVDDTSSDEETIAKDTFIYSEVWEKTILFKPYQNITNNYAHIESTKRDYISIMDNDSQLYGEIRLCDDYFEYCLDTNLKETLENRRTEELDYYTNDNDYINAEATEIKEGTFKYGEKMYAFIGDYTKKDTAIKTCHAIIDMGKGYIEFEVTTFANEGIDNNYMIGILNSIDIIQSDIRQTE